MNELLKNLAVNAVAAVFDKHLTSDRWRVDESDDHDLAHAARGELAEAIKSSLEWRWDGDPAGAEADFEDFRDRILWQAMVDLARDECSCTRRDANCPERPSRSNEYEQTVLAGGREVISGLVEIPDGGGYGRGSQYLACLYAYFEADGDDEAFSRMMGLRNVFARSGSASGNGLTHLHDADGC